MSKYTPYSAINMCISIHSDGSSCASVLVRERCWIRCNYWLMGRKKGDLNMATRKRLEFEREAGPKNKKLFDFRRAAKGPGQNSSKSSSISGNDVSNTNIKEGNASTKATENTVQEAAIREVETSHKEPDPMKAPTNSSLQLGALQKSKTIQELPKITEIEASDHWIKELVLFKYNECDIESPNIAVQTILACIRNKEIHEYITFKECNLVDKTRSPVTWLGFNGWFKLFSFLKKANFEYNKCKGAILEVYNDINSILYQRTCQEDDIARNFMKGLTALEKGNGIPNSFHSANEDNTETEGSECLFSDKDLFTGDQLANTSENPQESQGTLEEVPNLTLGNSSCFPIIIEQSVECLAAGYDHAIWKSQNFGALAPINSDTWIALAGITKDEISKAKTTAVKLEKIFTYINPGLPFDMTFFDEVCNKVPFADLICRPRTERLMP